MSYPNQNKIIIEKTDCNKENYYACINLYSLQCAAQNLGKSAFKLWVYLAKNQQNYSFYLSAADVAEWGLPQSTFYRARDELLEKGYLIPSGRNLLIFKDFIA